jgi:trk system potassium uptake protein
MARKRQEYCVIGLGRFGSSVARELTRRGATVLGIDRDAERVQHYAEDIAQTAVLDSTDESALREMDIPSFATVIVAIGNDFESSLITSVVLKQLGVKHVIAKAQTQRQREVLLRVGVDRVTLPEYEQGRYLAQELLTPGVIDQFDLGPGYRVSEMRVPVEFVGQRINEVALRAKFQATLLVVRNGEAVDVIPPPTYEFRAGDVLVLVGSNHGLDGLAQLDT